VTGSYNTWRWLLWPFFFFGILGWWALRFALIFGGILLAALILVFIL